MNIQGEWLILAERVINDEITQNLTLVSCLEQVAAAEFPSYYHGFAIAARFLVVGDPPRRDTGVAYRLLRLSQGFATEEIATFDGTWKAETTRTRVATNFGLLRLWRPERVTFRVDHRIGNEPWVEGPSASLDVVRLELSEEERATLAQERKRLGLVDPVAP